MLNRFIVFGSGLIGGSMARAVKSLGLADTVVLVNRRAETNNQALAVGVADEVYTYDQLDAMSERLRDGSKSAGHDVAVLAVPVLSYAALLETILPFLPDDLIMTDVGSTKASVEQVARSLLSPARLAHFVPGHPIAGSERSGLEAAQEALFTGRRVIVTPLQENHPGSVELIVELWRKIGADVDCMTVDHHDDVLAGTSHLPHLLAFTLVEGLNSLEEHPEIFRYAAGGFRDFTRIAESDPQMWTDIFIANKSALVKQLEHFCQHLDSIKTALMDEQAPLLYDTLVRAQAARRQYREDIDGIAQSATDVGTPNKHPD